MSDALVPVVEARDAVALPRVVVGGTRCRLTTELGGRPRRISWKPPTRGAEAACLQSVDSAGRLLLGSLPRRATTRRLPARPAEGRCARRLEADGLGPNLAHWSTPCRTCRPAAWVCRVLAHHYRSRAQGRAGSRTEGRQEVQAVESSGAAGRALEPSRFAFEEPRYFIAESPVSKSVAIATDPPMSAMSGASTTPYASTSPSSAKKINRRRPPPLIRNPGAIRARTFQRNGNCGLFGTIAGDDSGAFGLHGQLL